MSRIEMWELTKKDDAVTQGTRRKAHESMIPAELPFPSPDRHNAPNQTHIDRGPEPSIGRWLTLWSLVGSPRHRYLQLVESCSSTRRPLRGLIRWAFHTRCTVDGEIPSVFASERVVQKHAPGGRP